MSPLSRELRLLLKNYSLRNCKAFSQKDWVGSSLRDGDHSTLRAWAEKFCPLLSRELRLLLGNYSLRKYKAFSQKGWVGSSLRDFDHSP